MLKIARKTDSCRVLGPGNRAVVWFHGCSRNCKGCIAKSMNLSDDFEESSSDKLYEWIKKSKNIEGISISGGEPLEQNLSELSEFFKKVKEDGRNLSIILFTGFTYDEIIKSSKKSILQYIDVLIDGTYIENLNDNKGLRGSSNQKIYFLTDKYDNIKETFYLEDCRNIELEITLNNNIIINGIPRSGFIEEFSNSLLQEGFELDS